jgi:hypothetical protein
MTFNRLHGVISQKIVLFSILNRWENSFIQLLNVNGVNDVMQNETHVAKLLVYEPSYVEAETA